MSKIFIIYLNSTQKISGNNNDATYFIDWSSLLPRAKYKCSFIFTQTGSNISLVAAKFENCPALLYFIPGCNSNFSYNSMYIKNIKLYKYSWCVEFYTNWNNSSR